MEGKSLYTLPVVEKGRAAHYYCLVTEVDDGLQDGPICTWILLREQKMLSQGLVDAANLGTMLEALRADLRGLEWQTITIH